MTRDLCVDCGHAEDDHDGYGGLCDGFGWMDASSDPRLRPKNDIGSPHVWGNSCTGTQPQP